MLFTFKNFGLAVNSDIVVFFFMTFSSFSPYRYLIQKTHQLEIQLFTRALKWMEVEDIDDDETACILANLICEVG